MNEGRRMFRRDQGGFPGPSARSWILIVLCAGRIDGWREIRWPFIEGGAALARCDGAAGTLTTKLVWTREDGAVGECRSVSVPSLGSATNCSDDFGTAVERFGVTPSAEVILTGASGRARTSPVRIGPSGTARF